MATRTLGIIAALGMIAPVSAYAAYADAPGGDIVDQILKTLPPSPAHAAPMTSAAVTPPPPATPPGPAPASLATANPPPPGSAAVTPVLATPVPPPAPAPAPADSGDVLAGAGPTPAQSSDSSGQWTGLYLGSNFGYGFARGGGGLTCTNTVTGDSTGCPIVNSPALKASGVFGGAQIGYLMPLSALNLPLGSSAPPIMIGIEGDIQGTGIDAKQNVSGPINAVGILGPGCAVCSFTASQGIDWFSTVRGRIGVPVDDVFIYATGGVMFGAVRASQILNIGGGAASIATVKQTNSGPVFGGGLEFNLSGPFTAKIEGLYYDLGTVRTASVPVGGAPGNLFDFKSFGYRGAMIRVGINMKLGGLGGS
jgi:outer membrane immunogenic protein